VFWLVVLVVILATVCIFFTALGFAIKSVKRREIDPVYDDKVKKFYEKWDPIYKFFYNLVGWALALLVFYYVYLGVF
jgi:hypothetical protein